MSVPKIGTDFFFVVVYRTLLRGVLSLLLISWTPEHSIVTDLFVKHYRFFARSLYTELDLKFRRFMKIFQ